MKELDEIPREHLIEMLLEAAWYSGEREQFGSNQGFSYDVCEETCYRDVLYRDEKLYSTREQALIAHWKRQYKTP